MKVRILIPLTILACYICSAGLTYNNLDTPYLELRYNSFEYGDGFVVHIQATENYTECNRGYLEFVMYAVREEGSKIFMEPLEIGVGRFTNLEMVYVYYPNLYNPMRENFHFTITDITNKDFVFVVKKRAENEIEFIVLENDNGRLVMHKVFRKEGVFKRIVLNGFNVEYEKAGCKGLQAVGMITTIFNKNNGVCPSLVLNDVMVKNTNSYLINSKRMNGWLIFELYGR